MQLKYALQGPMGLSVVGRKHSWLSNLPGCSQSSVMPKKRSVLFQGMGSHCIVMAPVQTCVNSKYTQPLFYISVISSPAAENRKTCIISASEAQYYIPLVYSQSRWQQQHAGLCWSL